MTYEIVKSWFGRWRVYEVWHTGPRKSFRFWVATFRTEFLARSFVPAYQQSTPQEEK